MKIVQKIIIIAAIILSTSCEKNIEFNGEITDPQIVLNSYISTDSVVSVHLSKSRFFLSSKTDFVLVKNAKIDLYVNKSLKEQLSHVSDGWYKGTYKPKENDFIELVAKVPTYEDIKTNTEIPKKAVIVKIDTSLIIQQTYPVYSEGKIIGDNITGRLTIDITLKDNADLKNFYRVSMKTFQINDTTNARMNEWNTFFNMQGYDIKNGNIFDLLEGDLESKNYTNFHMLNDDLFNGKEIKLSIEQQIYFFKAKTGVVLPKEWLKGQNSNPSYEFNIQSVTRDMYLFIKSKEASRESVSNFISEPVVIYDNIENGIGILGSYIDNKTEIRMK